MAVVDLQIHVGDSLELNARIPSVVAEQIGVALLDTREGVSTTIG